MSDAALIKGKVCSDHLYKYVAIPPKLSKLKFMTYMEERVHLSCLTGTGSSEEKTVVETSEREGTVLQRWKAWTKAQW